MSSNEEQPYLVVYYGDVVEQLTESQYNAFCKNQDEGKNYVALKDGRRLAISGFQKIGPNPHYVSPESIIKGRKKRALLDEFQFLKEEGQLTTWKEYVVWKKKSIKNIKRFQDSMKNEENEKERTT